MDEHYTHVYDVVRNMCTCVRDAAGKVVIPFVTEASFEPKLDLPRGLFPLPAEVIEHLMPLSDTQRQQWLTRLLWTVEGGKYQGGSVRALAYAVEQEQWVLVAYHPSIANEQEPLPVVDWQVMPTDIEWAACHLAKD